MSALRIVAVISLLLQLVMYGITLIEDITVGIATLDDANLFRPYPCLFSLLVHRSPSLRIVGRSDFNEQQDSNTNRPH